MHQQTPDPRPPSGLTRTAIPVRLDRPTPEHHSGGESAGGVSPPAALRTGRDGLPSSGPHSPALGERDELPVGEQARLVLIHLLQPGHRFGVLAAESLELVHGPPDEVLVDAPCQETQLGAVEGPGRGRDRPCGRPPAQIPACGTTALGSCLGCERGSALQGRGAGCVQVGAIASRGEPCVPSSGDDAGCGAGAP